MIDIKKGDFVRLIPNSDVLDFKCKQLLDLKKRNLIMCVVSNVLRYNEYTYAAIRIHNNSEIPIDLNHSINVPISNLQLLSVKEFKEQEKENLEKLKPYSKEAMDQLATLKTIRKSYLTRDLTFSNFPKLSTNCNWIQTGNIENNNSFSVYNNNLSVTCCDLTKTTQDLNIFFPKV